MNAGARSAQQFAAMILPDAKHETIPALTVWQPWATLIAEGCKPFEFRGHAAPQKLVGQGIAIHAGARPMRRIEVANPANTLATDDWRQTGLTNRPKALDILELVWRGFRTRGRNESLPLSTVICTAVLGQPIRDEELAAKLGFSLVNDSDRDEHSNWGWPLTDVEPVIPMSPARGGRGFWRWTP